MGISSPVGVFCIGFLFTGHPMHDLVGPELKLSRANEHLDSLKGHIEEFIKGKPYTFQVDQHPKPPKYVIRAHINQSPPNGFGLIIGDFAHNARSALDLLVFQLSSLPAFDKARKKLGFPIFVCPNDYKTKKGKLLNGVPPNMCDIIEQAQPYHGTSRGDALSSAP